MSSTTLSAAAYHGPIGELVKAISPHTEADEPAVLVCLLAAFGSAVGFAPHFDHGKVHGANLFVGLVGTTATRKGTATSIAKKVMVDADPRWADRVQHEGFGSGEGLIWAVRDPKDDGAKPDPGVADKRLMVIEEEWAKTFTLSASDKSILTPTIRGAFDRIPIGKRNRGENAYGCKEPHVSIIANVTPDDLRMSLTGKNAGCIANGYLNRFLLVATHRRKHLPRGGRWREHAAPFVEPIRNALAVAKGRGLLALDPDAEGQWDALYATLEARPKGVAGDATARASDMVMKLALVYALADADDAIRVPHLHAALAVWRYCEATAFALFGGPAADPTPTPDPLWLRLLGRIEAAPGVLRSELTAGVKREADADAVGVALAGLQSKGLAYPAAYQNPKGGPKGERWFPGRDGDGGEGHQDRGDGDGGEGGDGERDNPYSPPPAPDPASLSADGGGLSPAADPLARQPPNPVTPPADPEGGVVGLSGCRAGGLALPDNPVGGAGGTRERVIVKQTPGWRDGFDTDAYLKAVFQSGCRLDKRADGRLVGKVPHIAFVPPLFDPATRCKLLAELLTEEEFWEVAKPPRPCA